MHLKNYIYIWQQTAASGRNITKQWVCGYLKWALDYFGFRWAVRVRTKHVFSRLVEMAIRSQTGTTPICFPFHVKQYMNLPFRVQVQTQSVSQAGEKSCHLNNISPPIMTLQMVFFSPVIASTEIVFDFYQI